MTSAFPAAKSRWLFNPTLTWQKFGVVCITLAGFYLFLIQFLDYLGMKAFTKAHTP